MAKLDRLETDWICAISLTSLKDCQIVLILSLDHPLEISRRDILKVDLIWQK